MSSKHSDANQLVAYRLENCDSACEHGCDGDHALSLSQENRWLHSKTQRLEVELVTARATIAQLEREKSLALRRLARSRR